MMSVRLLHIHQVFTSTYNVAAAQAAFEEVIGEPKGFFLTGLCLEMWLHVLRGRQEVLLGLPCSLDLMVFWSLLLRSHFMLHDMAGHTFLEDLRGSLSMCYQIFLKPYCRLLCGNTGGSLGQYPFQGQSHTRIGSMMCKPHQ